MFKYLLVLIVFVELKCSEVEVPTNLLSCEEVKRECPPKLAIQKFCGEHLVTMNYCEAVRLVCMKRKVTIYPGRCCPSSCDRSYEPLCGSDGYTRPNLCVFRQDLCKNEHLKLKHFGECQT
ncbi:hypothetical protein SNEBB_003338 [Seison nebaliae]|nr:hypothetical protein SNEBB_003338 [Seison nebaliae]